MEKTAILFVCLGNICRSPTAEGVFRHLVKARGLEQNFKIDSCGTDSWHVGELPHPKSVAAAAELGISLSGQHSRQLSPSDFKEFNYIVAMDKNNLRDIKKVAGNTEAQILLLREYDALGKDLSVPDPYYAEDGFEEVFEIVYRSCKNFLEHLINEGSA